VVVRCISEHADTSKHVRHRTCGAWLAMAASVGGENPGQALLFQPHLAGGR
jgi:hypothetical protein